ncbi:hypothetical protein IQ255_21470 [Pleurocapsales cyanobacterium LEGE 10410]|nr:hypothetical protein [Pleurocapsales cyanobacterium LEGE 10410]
MVIYPKGTYYVRIYGYQGSANPEYSLILNAPGADAYEANETMDTASDLGEISGLKVYENLSGDREGDRDWFAFHH